MKQIFKEIPLITRMTVMLSVCALLLPLSARAEIKPGSFEVSPFVGYNFFEKQQNLNDRFIYGGRFGYNLNKYFGIEGTVEFLRTSVDDKLKTGRKEGQYRSPMNKVNIAYYHIDALYHFLPDGKFTPFLVAGFGGTHYRPNISDQDMSTFNYGVGAKYWISDNLALRADVRDNLVTEVFQESYHNINATAGIVFAFGGSPKPAPARVAKYEPAPAPAPVAKAAAKPVEKVVIREAEPKAQEQVAILAAAPKVEEKIIILAFEDIHFDFDKSTLTPQAKDILRRNIQVLKDNPKAQIRIAGYTSASGSQEYNQKLSERRAKSVDDFLIGEGVIKAGRLSTIGYGENRPAEYESAPKDLYSPEAKANMRVLFEIVVR